MSDQSGEGRLLVVDVGNTQTHFGVFDVGSERVAEDWRFATDRESTSDEIAALLSNLLALRGLSFSDLGGSIVSSTVPQLNDQWRTAASRYIGHEMLVVGPSLKTGMPIRTENPYEVGADRLVNAVADLHWTAAIADLSALQPMLTGRLDASGDVSGPETDFAASAELHGTVSAQGIQSGPVN